MIKSINMLIITNHLQGTYESRISLLKLTRLLRLARLVGRVDRYSQVEWW